MTTKDYKVGMKFRPTFSSNIDYFEVRGYDEERDMVLTKVYPKEGNSFDDEIEARYFDGAFETGEYKEIASAGTELRRKSLDMPEYTIHNYYDFPEVEPEVKFDGPCCGRCQHRFGTTSNKKFCSSHYDSERCYRFKLEK